MSYNLAGILVSEPDLDDDEILVSDPDLLRLLRELSLRNRCILFGSVPKYLNSEKNIIQAEKSFCFCLHT